MKVSELFEIAKSEVEKYKQTSSDQHEAEIELPVLREAVIKEFESCGEIFLQSPHCLDLRISGKEDDLVQFRFQNKHHYGIFEIERLELKNIDYDLEPYGLFITGKGIDLYRDGESSKDIGLDELRTDRFIHLS